MVHVTPDGTVYAFVVGTGLIEPSSPNSADKRSASIGVGGDHVRHFAVDLTSHNKVYAITFNPENKAQAVLASTDAGESWAPGAG